jgi:threonine/homoserine/homoserine lactone efflux protein
MISILSLVTSVKDYVEIVHKLIETDSNFKGKAFAFGASYSDLGPIITYTLITLKEFLIDVISLNWLKGIWDLPIIIPDISSAMISEISVLDGYFHNAFNFLDKPISYGETNIVIYSLEKFSVGLINSLFLCIPTGTTHLITLRRFLMQGLEAGYLAGLGSICGNILWISSIVLGCRFFVIPWLSLDIFRYLLGFVLLVKYMWDSYGDSQKKIDISTTPAKQKIFLLNFLLALTEQTSIYPFISNISVGSESSLLESFPAQNYLEFLSIHGSYIFGLVIGSLSLLHFTCWFWENPAFKIYMWTISSFKISTTFYYKVLNFTFLYLTMICAISSIPYYGLDYTLTNPLGFVQDDRILDQKLILETSFLNSKASDRNTRRNRGRHGRRERWKRRIRKYRTFDASLYDQGIYDLFTIEDLNYGFDRFWLRRKMRNHRVRFRFFPGPWMRSFKKQLAKPRLESYAGPRQEFFRILFEQVYHPSFHEYSNKNPGNALQKNPTSIKTNNSGRLSSSARSLPLRENIFSQSKSLRSQNLPLEEKDSIQGSLSKNLENSASGLAIRLPTNNLNSSRSEKESPSQKHDIPLYETENIFSLLPKKEFSIYNDSKTPLDTKDLSPNLLSFFSRFSFSLPAPRPPAGMEPEEKKEVPGSKMNSPILKKEKRFASTKYNTKENLKIENSTLRKFVRKINSRLKNSEIKSNLAFKINDPFKRNNSLNKTDNSTNASLNALKNKLYTLPSEKLSSNSLYSKRWKEIFSKISHDKEQLAVTNGQLKGLFKNFYQTSLHSVNKKENFSSAIKKENSKIILSKQDKQILKYRSILDQSKETPLFSQKLPLNGRLPSGSNSLMEGLKLSKESLENSSSIKTLSNNFVKGDLGGQLKTSTLLHPLKFYLKKQEAFERKLRYYTPTIFRKFSIENNAPYFRVMMKRYFYFFKPTLRWERTMKVASLRKARRKTSVSPRKIQEAKSSNSNNFLKGNIGLLPSGVKENNNFLNKNLKDSTNQNNFTNSFDELAESSKQATGFRKVKATHNYTIVGKRASRFRYEIYKDVLQHWYYSPFNRLLLKFDIDLFIKRQPNSHFLTKSEEKLLHLRRFLLSEHYDTLRWYSYMQHYRSMKTKIGGTKSFASKVYNQQFSGTFKKIRHLFAITPSQSNQSVLKFDQPLYNESFNNSKNSLQKNLIIHEELLNTGPLESLPLQGFESFPPSRRLSAPNMEGLSPEFESKSLGMDLLNQSTQIVGTYLKNSSPIKQEYIKNLIEDKNYSKLTQFLYKGQKTRGLKPITNERSLLNQEKEYLLTDIEKEEFKNLEKIKLNKMLRPLQQDLWINLLKRWKRKVNDQEFLKNYLQRRIEKRDKRKQKKERNLKIKLERLETWLSLREEGEKNQKSNSNLSTTRALTFKKEVMTTGVNNAIIEGILTFDEFGGSKTLLKEERINLSNKIKTLAGGKAFPNKNLLSITNSSPNAFSTSGKKLFLKKFIKTAGESSATEKELSPIEISLLKKLTGLIKDLNRTNSSTTNSVKYQKPAGLKTKVLGLATKIKNIYKNYRYNSSKLIVSSTNKLINIFKPIIKRKKNLKNWQQIERSLNKQKRSRKEFKLFSKKPFQNNIFSLRENNNFSKYLDQKLDLPLNLSGPTSPQNQSQSQADFGATEGLLSTEGKEKKKLPKISSPSIRERKKRDFSKEVLETTRSTSGLQKNFSSIIKETYSKYFSQNSKFKRKKSPQRRARVRRNRGVTKKRTLSDSLKREFKNLRKYGASATEKMDGSASNNKIDTRKQKIYLSFRNAGDFENLSKESLPLGSLPLQTNVDGIFKQSSLQRRSKQKKQRFWKQKRSKYSQKLRKYKKRRRSVLGKVRILNKQLKRIQSTTELKNWWWTNFLPNLRSTTDSLLQLEKDRQIQQKLLELSVPEILERDKFNNLEHSKFLLNKNLDLTSLKSKNSSDYASINMLQIGDFDFKPLSMPEAIRLRGSLKNNNILNKQSMSNSQMPNNANGGKLPSELDNTKNILGFIREKTDKNSASPNAQKIETSDKQKMPANSISKNDIVSKLSQASLAPLLENEERFASKMQSPTSREISSSSSDEYLRSSSLPKQNLNILDELPLKQIFSSNTVPFYAGWDESLRKFVVTNRLLSRRSSGFEMRTVSDFNSNNISRSEESNALNSGSDKEKNTKSELLLTDNFRTFSEAPLKGMNAATTLYWQIPFTTYDPDQFFALGMDGFAPLGWRRFQFRHSILKSWLMDRGKSIKNISPVSKTFNQASMNKKDAKASSKNNSLIVEKQKNIFMSISKNKTNLLDRIYGQNFQSDTVLENNIFDAYSFSQKNGGVGNGSRGIKLSKTSNKNSTVRNIYRRLKKRYKRVKKHPRSPVWFPSGPLLNQVLPVHYIYIFYKRSRLPRDRYIKRRLRKSKTSLRTPASTISQDNAFYSEPRSNLVPTKDFTLRKRVKTKRKYHIKQDVSKNSPTPLIPRRMKFIGEDASTMRWRPLSRQKINKPIAELIKEQRALKYKQRKKDQAAVAGNNKQPSNLRVKQLRRRVQRQIIRSVWRYRPRAGGFVWPGDYLKLEQVKATKLNTSSLSLNKQQNTINTDLKSTSLKIKRKKKRNIQEWQIQPKKYLLEKHNLNAIKKKLEKANRSNKIRERVKELNLTL